VTPEAVVAGNIGCLTQISRGINVPVLHTIELLDWSYGGDKPEKLNGTSAN
jgi:glycolate oxidase iron-sulfur subunit